LRQLLLNLVDNAIKYNRPGGTVTLSLRHTASLAEMQIVNTGKGVAPELQTRVFDRFVRGENALGSAVEGSGLGLTIARWIVQAHGGTIELNSQTGGTTTVRVQLPLANP
jgi:two-component system phosphate regulon sensor histidine kinase PhoR